MTTYDCLITVLGWEDRFKLGFEDILNSNHIKKVMLICFTDYLEYTNENLVVIENICKTKNIELIKLDVIYADPIKTWKSFQQYFLQKNNHCINVLLDITTTPRETIWTLIFFLKQTTTTIAYTYYKPKEYNQGWLSREPEKPRLLLKHSGVSDLGKQTALIIITGFDPDRTRQLVNFYDPKITVLGIQKGTQFENDSRNNNIKHLNECRGQGECDFFEIDAYSTDHGFSLIKQQIESLKDYNIVISSMGPKLSAISQYKIFIENPSIALSYVPSKEYSKNYSSGIAEKIEGIF